VVQRIFVKITLIMRRAVRQLNDLGEVRPEVRDGGF
jgi:hypothetical protein